MTEEELAAIESRAAAATPGPWVSVAGAGRPAFFLCTKVQQAAALGMLYVEADADFAAAARSDVPALVAEVRLLQAVLGDKLQDDARLAEGYRRGVLAALGVLQNHAAWLDEASADPKAAVRRMASTFRIAAAAVRALLDGR